jgi:hypothetical protein
MPVSTTAATGSSSATTWPELNLTTAPKVLIESGNMVKRDRRGAADLAPVPAATGGRAAGAILAFLGK